MEQTNKYQRSIDRLNDALGKEISTTLQYIYFHTIFEDAGYEHLASLMRRISIQEMQHIEHIAERILFLQGKVDMNPSFRSVQINGVREALEFSCSLEQSTIESYNEYSRLCSGEDDAVTHRIFQDMSAEEEQHLDIFRTELQNMIDYGAQYLALQSVAHSRNVAKMSKKEE
ncbi:MAG: bacterioferritin [Alistipes sp.]|nr:bacterioferritin [Alistipes sp.]